MKNLKVGDLVEIIQTYYIEDDNESDIIDNENSEWNGTLGIITDVCQPYSSCIIIHSFLTGKDQMWELEFLKLV